MIAFFIMLGVIVFGMGANESMASTASLAPKNDAGKIALAIENRTENAGFDEVEGEARMGSRVVCAEANGMKLSTSTGTRGVNV